PEEFQQAAGPAVTRRRHVKGRGVRHEKDDRDRAADPRHFVLGWDNGEKRRRLADEVRGLRDRLAGLDRRAAGLEQESRDLRGRQAAARAALEFTDFGAIDPAAHERDVAALQSERRRLEEDNDAVRLLKGRLAEAEARHAAL